MFAAAIPILRIFDEALARDFYLRWLGFGLDWDYRSAPGLPLYAQVSRGALRLHLSGHHGDTVPGATVFVPVADVTALHAELAERGHPGQSPGIVRQDWGLEMTVTDPFSNRLRFTEQRGG